MPPFQRTVSLESSLSSSSSSSSTATYIEARQKRSSIPRSIQTVSNDGCRSAVNVADGSIRAVIGYLSEHLSACSITELNGLLAEGQYFPCLMRIKEYQSCLSSTDEIQYLLIGCWNSVLRYYAVQYKHAYKTFHSLRNAPPSLKISLMTSSINVEKALQTQMELAELCSSCQRELILAQRREKRLSNS